MDFTKKLQAYVSATTGHAKKQLQGWFNLEILGLSDLALATFYFLYRAIDDNENKRPGEEAEDYLLVLPDAALEEEALYGALLGAILGKYRANYMDATRTTTEYSTGDILLSAKKNGEYQLWQVESGLKNDEIKTSKFGNANRGEYTLTREKLEKCIRLLSKRQANHFKLGLQYPDKPTQVKLASAVNFIRQSLEGAELISNYPHRMGVICSTSIIQYLAENHPMPVRNWSVQHNPALQLPLPPMAEVARNYEDLRETVFCQPPGPYSTVEELLIFDIKQYCDGNGKFADLLHGRHQGYYRNLVLIGSRAPYVPPGQMPHPFKRWEWTPEELAILQNKTLRYPRAEAVVDPAIQELHVATLATWQRLESAYGLRLNHMRRWLFLFYQLVLPPDGPNSLEALRQTTGLLFWIDEQLNADDIFAEALIYDRARVDGLRLEIRAGFVALAKHLRAGNNKFECVAAHCAQTGDTAPATVVLMVRRRDLSATEAALKSVLSAQHISKLRVVDGSKLHDHLRNAALNHERAVWLLPSLRIGRQQDNELSVYRRLLTAKAQIKTLAYEHVETERYVQLAVLHRQLVERALLHEDREHFMGSALRMELPVLTETRIDELPLATLEAYQAEPEPSAEEQALFQQLDTLFGEPGNGLLPEPRELKKKSPDKLELEPGLDDEVLGPTLGQTCVLQFKGDYTRKVLFSKKLDVLIELPTGRILMSRYPAELCPGDQVLLLNPDSPRLLAYLQQDNPERFALVDAASRCWREVLLRLVHRYKNSTPRLHVKLKAHGLRLRLERLEQWLRPDSTIRFPKARKSLAAIAALEHEAFGAEASLKANLSEIFEQQIFYNGIVSQKNRNYRGLLLHTHAEGESATIRQALGDAQFEALRDYVQSRIFIALHPR